MAFSPRRAVVPCHYHTVHKRSGPIVYSLSGWRVLKASVTKNTYRFPSAFSVPNIFCLCRMYLAIKWYFVLNDLGIILLIIKNSVFPFSSSIHDDVEPYWMLRNPSLQGRQAKVFIVYKIIAYTSCHKINILQFSLYIPLMANSLVPVSPSPKLLFIFRPFYAQGSQWKQNGGCRIDPILMHLVQQHH